MNAKDENKKSRIESVIEDYFRGLYECDVERLRQIFDPNCILFGEHNGERLQMPVTTFFDFIEQGPVPKDVGEPFDMKIVTADQTHSVATAKLDVLYQGERYMDYLLMHEGIDGWRIVSKGFQCPA